MGNSKINHSRRRVLVQGASLISGVVMSPLIAGCENRKPVSRRSGGKSRYLKYKDKLDKCFSAVLQDVMDGMGVRVQCMDPKIKPLLPNMKTWGEAVTIYLEEVTEVPEKPFQMEMELLDDTVEGLAFNHLHGEIADALLQTFSVDRDDIGVAKPCGGPRLAVKPLDCRPVTDQTGRQHFQCHMTV